MLNGPLVPAIMRFAIPVFLTTFLQNLFNTADMIVIGQFCGSLKVAAVSSTSSLTNLLIGLFTGLSLGAGLTVARAIGTRQEEDISQAVHTAIPLALIGGLILSVVGVSVSPPLLRLLKTPADVLPLSSLYMQIYFSGILFTGIYNFGSAILRAIGDTKTPLYFLIISGVLNVIMNLFFVTVLHMDVAGVALATVISQAVSATLIMIVLIRRNDVYKFSFKKMHIHKKALGNILRIGLPAGIQSSLFSVSNVITASAMNSFNSAAILSANGASQSLEVFTDSIGVGFSQAVPNFVAQNLGALQYNRIKKSLIICLSAATVCISVACCTMYLFREPLLGLYITDSTEAISYGMVRMRYMLLPGFLMATMTVSTGGLQGLGHSLMATVISLTTACGLRIAWIYTIFQIPEYHTLDCIYAMYPISWILTTAICVILFFRILKKKASISLPVVS